MSRRSHLALGACSALAVVTTLLSVTPASVASSDPSPRAAGRRPVVAVAHARADGHHTIDSQATVDIPAGGGGKVISPEVPKGLDRVKIAVSAPLSDDAGFKKLAFALAVAPSKGSQLMICTMAALRQDAAEYTSAVASQSSEDLATYQAEAETIFLLRMQMCLHLAQLVAQVLDEGPDTRSAPRSSPSCGQLFPGVEESITKTGDSYVMSGEYKTAKPRKAKVKVKCKIVGRKAVLTVKPKKKGKTLRQVLGKNIGISIGSPASATQGAKVTVAFKGA